MAQPPSHTNSASSGESWFYNSANSDPLPPEVEEILSMMADWPRPHNLLISTDEGDLRRGQFSSEGIAGNASSGAMFPDEQPEGRNGLVSQDSDGYERELEWIVAYAAALYRLEHSNDVSNIPISSSHDSFADAPAGSLDDSRKRPKKGLRGPSLSSSKSFAASSDVVNTDHSSSRPESKDSESRSSRHSDEIQADGRSSRPSPALASSAYFSFHSVDIA